MNGVSFKMSPLQTLQIVMTSMIAGEAQYYRPHSFKMNESRGEFSTSEDLKDVSTFVKLDVNGRKFKEYFLFSDLYSNSNSDSENKNNVNTYITQLVLNALDDDFAGCIKLIETLRNEYLMRLNPQILLVSALLHKNRENFNKNNPKVMKHAILEAGVLPTDLCKQYELIKQAGVNPPSIWKRTVAEKLEGMSRYHAIKYINGSKSGNSTKTKPNMADIIESRKALTNLVDLVRITHPAGKEGSVIEELVKTGKVKSIDLEEDTWERLRSSGKSWKDILATIRVPHMALLRNLRNIIQEYSQDASQDEDDIDHSEEITKIGKQLVDGVIGGKQFPFRYFSAYRSIKDNSYEKFGYRRRGADRSKTANKKVLEVAMNTKYIDIIQKALEACLQKSLTTIPELEGRVDCLTDNSGSAHGAFVSEYGSVKVAEISNLSAILTAMRSTKGGSVWIFGDSLVEFRVDKNGSILNQLDQVNMIGKSIGAGTETGIWLFWNKVIKEKKNLDTVFIYSDQQAGYGGLYADHKYKEDMKGFEVEGNSRSNYSAYVDVLKLVDHYRTTVNSKMNIFSVQVAGYDNSVIPSLIYRGAVLSGWTGKEAKMAYEMIKVWDEVENGEHCI